MMAEIDEHWFSPATLQTFITKTLSALGLPDQDAFDCGRLMVASDMAGFHTHGIFRLPQYVKRILAGGINKSPTIKTAVEAPSTAVVDGDNGMGHLVVEYATKLAIKKASESGCAWVGARSSNHAGAASTYVAMAAEEKMVAIYGTNGSANHMAPWGSTDLLLGTNPIAAAIPRLKEPPIVMDFATTVTSFGKVRTAAQRGEKLPPDWMIDKEGNPITDSSRIHEGILNPIGGHKGYALSLVIGLLSATLSGAKMGVDVEGMGDAEYQRTPVNNGHFMIVVDPARFGNVTDFFCGVDEVSNVMRQATPMKGIESIRVPGDGRAASIKAAKQFGVPVHEALLNSLNDIAEGLGIPALAK